jgi:molybdate transport system substrate-binding protein
MTHLHRWTATALLALLPALAAAQTLTVSAAASLTDAFKALAPQFEASRPGVTLRFNFAASGVLVQQIIQGAPADVFVSADGETMDRGLKEGVLDPATRRDVAGNTVVMVVPADAAAPPASVAALAGPAVRRVALGKPASVPVGRYTQQGLEAAGLWAAVSPKAVYADNVRQALDYVSRGEVDAGFVYRTDAALLPGRVRVVQALQGHAPVRYPAAVVRDSRQAALALAFLDFLRSPSAQAVLAAQGFTPP